jgi:glycosyltransferase involved in cell wall biosynthesis
MLISVCIPSLRTTTLRPAIEAIRRQTWAEWELIVVGQGNDPHLRALVEEVGSADPRVRYIHLAEPGLSGARNAGIASSIGDIIAMTDDDCEADSEWLYTLAHCFQREPAVGLIGGALLKPKHVRGVLATCPSLTPLEAVYDPIAMRRQAPIGWDWIGGNFAIRRHVFNRVGPFDRYLGAGAPFPSAEDTDYKLRLEAYGIVMRSTPQAIVYHTYGTRYGVRAGLHHSRNYARGNGALAGKLTLRGDPRGREWLQAALRESTTDWLFSLKLHRLPVSVLRLHHFKRAYQRCLTEFRVDPVTDLLYAARSDVA